MKADAQLRRCRCIKWTRTSAARDEIVNNSLTTALTSDVAEVSCVEALVDAMIVMLGILPIIAL